MKPFFVSGLLLTVTLVFANTALGEELVAEFKGSGAGLTDEFEIKGPWILDWAVMSDFPSSAGIEISLVEGIFLDHKGVAVEARWPTAGTRMFYDTGTFRFRVTATLANWHLRISTLTEKEAAAMIPKRAKKK